ncbi:MAG TPA: hypothetical protein VLH78_00115 [Candidatus Nanoarchaeia archaeon]|nr:hypothetical protein [Candidatus Nanoarchaeia archaeon]
MRIVIFLAGSLTVCGFYVYVLAQLYREEKRFNARKKHLQEHLHEMESETPSARAKRIMRTVNSRIALGNRGALGEYDRPPLNTSIAMAPGSNAEDLARRETIISLVIGVGGLAALFVGIEIFNSLVTWAH